MNSGGESSVFRHFRLLSYLFLLSEYLSGAPEGMQTNDALHHEVTLTHGPSLHILRKLISFQSLHVPPIQNPVLCDILHEEVLVFFRKSVFEGELLLEKPINILFTCEVPYDFCRTR